MARIKLLTFIFILLLMSCATTNLTKKVGVYKYDDVKEKLGSPKSTDVIASGNFICKWRSSPSVVTLRPLGQSEPIDQYYEYTWTILTFNSDSLLTDVKYEKEREDY